MVAEIGKEFRGGCTDIDDLTLARQTLVALKVDAPTALASQEILGRIASITGINHIGAVQNLLTQIISQALAAIQEPASQPTHTAEVISLPTALATSTHDLRSQQVGSAPPRIDYTSRPLPDHLPFGPQDGQASMIHDGQY